MRNPYNGLALKLDVPTARMIGFTSDLFEYGTIYNCLPQGLYINSIWPRAGKEDTAIEQMLNTFEELRIRVVFTAPQSYIIKHLKQHGYVYYKDKAGCPHWTRLSEKGIAALCGRLNLTPEQLIQQSRDYVV